FAAPSVGVSNAEAAGTAGEIGGGLTTADSSAGSCRVGLLLCSEALSAGDFFIVRGNFPHFLRHVGAGSGYETGDTPACPLGQVPPFLAQVAARLTQFVASLLPRLGGQQQAGHRTDQHTDTDARQHADEYAAVAFVVICHVSFLLFLILTFV